MSSFRIGRQASDSVSARAVCLPARARNKPRCLPHGSSADNSLLANPQDQATATAWHQRNSIHNPALNTTPTGSLTFSPIREGTLKREAAFFLCVLSCTDDKRWSGRQGEASSRLFRVAVLALCRAGASASASSQRTPAVQAKHFTIAGYYAPAMRVPAWRPSLNRARRRHYMPTCAQQPADES